MSTIPSKSDAAWLHTQSAALPARTLPEQWEATRAQSMVATQIMRDLNEPETSESRDIGRLVGDNQRELFVSCGPAEAMRQQFEILDPTFIAVHDIGTALSRKLLAGVAAASGRQVQRLVIRRQGYGTPLAALEFIEWPTAQGTVLRLYTTEIDADTSARTALAIALLAHSRLGVVIVGDLPTHALHAALYPLQQGLLHGPWPNRDLLMLPLTSASAVASQSSQLAGHSGVTVRTTPQISRPAEAWGFISGTWNHLHDSPATRGMQLPGLSEASATSHPAGAFAGAAPAVPLQSSAAAAAMLAAAAARQVPAHTAAAASAPAVAPTPTPARPLPLRPMPNVPGPQATPMSFEDTLTDYVGHLIKLNGMLACTVFETATARTLAHAGTRYTANALAEQGRALIDAALQGGQALGMAVGGAPELALSLDAHHLVLRPLPHRPELMLHAVFDKHIANLTLARLQIQRFDEDFAP